MPHERLDINYWKHLFPIPHMQIVEGTNVVSEPHDIALIEQLRERAFEALPDMIRIPTDIFLWNYGEPEQQAVTKIGGLPYRVAGKPWPIAPSGIPLTFVAQFCFVDSHDLVPSLPGDLLLIFIEGKDGPMGYDFVWGHGEEHNSVVVFEWVSLTDMPLVTKTEVPETPWQVIQCYGTIYRTWDYPEADDFASPDIASQIATIIEGTKIGGAYPFPWIEQRELGTYLCTLASISWDETPYLFLNIPAPIPAGEWYTYNALNIGDMGLMNIFLAPDGTIRWMADS